MYGSRVKRFCQINKNHVKVMQFPVRFWNLSSWECHVYSPACWSCLEGLLQQWGRETARNDMSEDLPSSGRQGYTSIAFTISLIAAFLKTVTIRGSRRSLGIVSSSRIRVKRTVMQFFIESWASSLVYLWWDDTIRAGSFAFLCPIYRVLQSQDGLLLRIEANS